MSVKSPFNPDGTKKVILSIDGGGMRGTISAAMLSELERITGSKCHELFDMIAGTSTGSIIAVGIALGIPASEILQEVYRNRLPAAFRDAPIAWFPRFMRGAASALGILSPANADLFIRLLSNNLRFAFAREGFLDNLKPLVGQKRISDLGSSPALFVTTKDVLSGEIIYIVSVGKGRAKVKDWPLSGVVAASGAAPIFFPPALGRLVDGAVGVYGNPCLAAAIEAMEYLSQDDPGYRDGNVVHLSIGTGYVLNQPAAEKVRKYGIFDWLKYLVSEGMDESTTQQVFTTRAIYGTARMDFRRYNPLLTADSVQHRLGIDLIGKPNPTQLSLASFQSADITLMEEIGTAYARKIDWAAPFMMPWNTEGGQCHPSDIECNAELSTPIVWTPEYL